uniref:pleckstrin homology domain-containing family A member 8 isoform X2 n=1 Tax=Myxine glutinosa TaxID=7769 RepID=UPI00358F4979
MEGTLRKWTNYFSGWQPRWFFLEGGVLSYYDSQDDVGKGCKGSLKMMACEIHVNSTDQTRLDLVIPGEQHFYLRTLNAAERQRWLVALGSAKACLCDGRTRKEKELDEAGQSLRTKMSELRLYCNLMTQQVTKIRESIQAIQPDVDTMTEASSLLGATCVTFVHTLDECVRIASSSLTQDLPRASATEAPASPVARITLNPRFTAADRTLNKKCEMGSNRSKAAKEREDVLNSSHYDPHGEGTKAPARVRCPPAGDGRVSPTNPPPGTPTPLSGTPDDADGWVRIRATHKRSGSSRPAVDTEPTSLKTELCDTRQTQTPADITKNPSLANEHIQTFFSAMELRFSDVEFEEDDGIPVEPFLKACSAIVPLLDKLGPTAFAPVKLDFVGNIKKMQQKQHMCPERFTTLQRIVTHELDTGTALLRNSATEALLWLKRGLKFLKEFLMEVKNGEKDLGSAVQLMVVLYDNIMVGSYVVCLRWHCTRFLHSTPSLQPWPSILAMKNDPPSAPSCKRILPFTLARWSGSC